MGFGLGSALSIGGTLLGGLGNGKNKGAEVVPSGYKSLPKELQDYLLKDLFPQMQDYQKKPYEGIPLRRINESDADPVFGSKARQDIQAYRDYMLAQAPVEEVAPQAAAPDGDLMRAYAELAAGAATKGSHTANLYNNNFLNDPEKMKAIAALMRQKGLGAESFTQGYSGTDMLNNYLAEQSKTKAAPKNTTPIDLSVMMAGQR